MSLDKKYQISPETIKNMVIDGIIPCSVVRNHELYDSFIKHKKENPQLSVKQIILNMSVESGLSVSSIEKIIYPVKNLT